MSKLHLGTDIVSLAAKLAGNLEQAARRGDCFLPTTIVVPSHYLKKWLRLDLARRFGVGLFHFRGFLQNGLSPSLGPFAALWVQVLASSLLHFGRPDSEIWASIPAGLLWGLQARYTGSIWAGVAQHWLLGATLDYFICFG